MVTSAALAHKPTLTGRLVTLVPLGPEHAEALFASVEDLELRRLTGTHRKFTREEIDRWCATRAEQDDRIDLAILDSSDGGFAGELALLDYDAANESVGYRIALHTEHTGRGLGTEATRLVLDHVFGTIGLHRVQLEVYDFNERALRCYATCGFRAEGRLREALRWNGERHDTIVMAALRSEWQPASS